MKRKPGIRVILWNRLRIWRFEILYNKKGLQIYWLSNYKYFENLVKFDYEYATPLLRIGEQI